MKALFSWRGHRFLAVPIRLYLSLVFLFASYHKVLDPASFALDIATYQIVPLAFVNLMALVLPWVEVVTGFLLLIGWRTRAAALLMGGMMVMFTAAISIALAKGLNMSCGCFASQGATTDPISWHTILRDTAWLLLSLYVLIFDRIPLGLDGWLILRREEQGARLP